MRILERFNTRQLLARLSGAYKKAFDQDDGKLLIRDIVSFAELAEYRTSVDLSADQLLVLEGRRQMAMHILRHLDIDPREMIEYQNDAKILNSQIEE